MYRVTHADVGMSNVTGYFLIGISLCPLLRSMLTSYSAKCAKKGVVCLGYRTSSECVPKVTQSRMTNQA
jgi:hypothetical protein